MSALDAPSRETPAADASPQRERWRRWGRYLLFALPLLAQVIALPALLVYWTLNPQDMASGGAWYSWVVVLALILAYFLVVQPWAQVGWGLRLAFPGALAAAAWVQAGWASGALCAAALAGGSWAIRRWAGGRRPAACLDLAVPLAGGVYFVAHGGAERILNYHHPSDSQRYALDIFRLNRLGMRAWGLFPRRLTRYAIYGASVLAPCEGVVTAAVDGLPEAAVRGERDFLHAAGNYVLIRCAGAPGGEPTYVGLAHLAPGSVCVRAGQRVARGDLIGRAGNSGNSTEPHLHIHAKMGGDPEDMLDGRGVAITFAGRFLCRNDLFRGQRAGGRQFLGSTGATAGPR